MRNTECAPLVWPELTKVAVKGDVREGRQVDVEDGEAGALLRRAVEREDAVLGQDDGGAGHARVAGIADVDAGAVLRLVCLDERAIQHHDALQVLQAAPADQGPAEWQNAYVTAGHAAHTCATHASAAHRRARIARAAACSPAALRMCRPAGGPRLLVVTVEVKTKSSEKMANRPPQKRPA